MQCLISIKATPDAGHLSRSEAHPAHDRRTRLCYLYWSQAVDVYAHSETQQNSYATSISSRDLEVENRLNHITDPRSDTTILSLSNRKTVFQLVVQENNIIPYRSFDSSRFNEDDIAMLLSDTGQSIIILKWLDGLLWGGLAKINISEIFVHMGYWKLKK